MHIHGIPESSSPTTPKVTLRTTTTTPTVSGGPDGRRSALGRRMPCGAQLAQGSLVPCGAYVVPCGAVWCLCVVHTCGVMVPCGVVHIAVDPVTSLNDSLAPAHSSLSHHSLTSPALSPAANSPLTHHPQSATHLPPHIFPTLSPTHSQLFDRSIIGAICQWNKAARFLVRRMRLRTAELPVRSSCATSVCRPCRYIWIGCSTENPKPEGCSTVKPKPYCCSTVNPKPKGCRTVNSNPQGSSILSGRVPTFGMAAAQQQLHDGMSWRRLETHRGRVRGHLAGSARGPMRHPSRVDPPLVSEPPWPVARC